jgi:hypothetical protein
VNAKAGKHPDHQFDLTITQQVVRRQEYTPAMQGFFRHTVSAAQVTTIED